MKLDFKYKSWNDISIKMYKDIVTIGNDDSLSDTEKEIAIIALLCDIPEEKVWSECNINDIKAVRQKLGFISEVKPSGKHIRNVMVGDTKCHIEYDVNKMNVAQYVDFQNYWCHNDNNDYMSRILSVFIIPDGKKYGDGYDMAEFIDTIENNLPISIASDIVFFFVRQSMISINIIQTYLEWMTKWKMRIAKDKTEKEMYKQMNRMAKATEQLFGYISLKK